MLKSIIVLAAAASLATGASAQTAPAARSGGLAGLLGGAIPNVGGIGAGNAAGLLGYCIQNNLLGGLAGQATGAASSPAAPASGAQSIFQRLTGRQGVTASPGYQAGQNGQVVAPGGQALSLDGLRGQVKNRVCSAVLSRAKSFL